jgi:hypothetical protein
MTNWNTAEFMPAFFPKGRSEVVVWNKYPHEATEDKKKIIKVESR